MLQGKVVADFFKKWQTELTVASTFIFLLILVLWPLAVFRTSGEWQSFSSYTTYLYMLITFGTLVVVILAARFTVHQLRLTTNQLMLTQEQLSENVKNRKLDTILELWKVYATEEMGRGLHAVYNMDTNEMVKAAVKVRETNPLRIPSKIPIEWQLHNQRCLVSDYYALIAWEVEQGVLDMELIYSRFGSSAFGIWGRLRPIEFELRKSIEKRNLEEKGEHTRLSSEEFEKKVSQQAERHVDNDLPIARVARAYQNFVQEKEKSQQRPQSQ